MKRLHLLLPLLIAFTIILCTTEADDVDYRLPKIYVPENYQVYLNVSASAFTESGSEYSGTVTIKFTVTEDTNDIKLHASYKDFRINRVVVSGHDIDILDYNVDEVTDVLTIVYPVGLVSGQPNVLTIDFSGDLSNDEDGFYKSSYKDDSGTIRYLATTQFETISARRAFPCFDEPAFKATFDISITYPLGYNAISNTPGSISFTDSESNTIQFETTPRMSTYLLAFVISDFTAQKVIADDGVVHQVWSRNNTNNARDWAIEMGPKMLEQLSNFTGYPYSKVMKKMDQGAIPDFAAGAMENWGIVLYREGDVLWDSEKNSNNQKQTVATVICHEFSHQWFGDLVTLNWWSETFLNEGFATYCEFNIAHEVLPDYHLDDQFVLEVVQPVLLEDAYRSALPLESEASTPSEIGRKFDAISYYKGGSILRMLDHALGRDNFRAGVRNYIELNKFGNAVPSDLWNALNEKVDISVAKLPTDLPEIMENWTLKAGYPLLHVSLKDSKITVAQERFLFSDEDPDSTKWYVPITYTTSMDKNKFIQTSPIVWLTPDSNLTIDVPEEASWIILNNQLTGYYRVIYDEALWKSIGEALRREDFDGIGELNRAQIVDDIFNLATAPRGGINYSTVLDFVEFLANDTAFTTWVPAFSGFDYLLTVLEREGDYELIDAIEAQILRLMTALYESSPPSKPNADDQIYTLKRVLAADWACALGNQDCIDYSLANFASYKNDGVQLDNNLKYIVCCYALRYSTDRSDLEFLEGVFANASAAEQYYLAGALACSPDEEVTEILEEYLHKLMNKKSGIRPQDLKSTFSDIYDGHPKGVDIVFRFLMENYNTVAKRFRNLNVPGDILKSVARKFSKRAQIDKLREMIKNRSLPKEFLLAANAALEIAELNVQWKDQFEDEIKEYYGLKS